MGRPKLVQSLDSVYTCSEMLLIFLLGDANIDYKSRPADVDGPKKDINRLWVFAFLFFVQIPFQMFLQCHDFHLVTTRIQLFLVQ